MPNPKFNPLKQDPSPEI